MEPVVKYCIIDEQEFSGRSKYDICPRCRGVYKYWMKKPPGAILERQKNLHRWQTRMTYLAEEENRYKKIRPAFKKELNRPVVVNSNGKRE